MTDSQLDFRDPEWVAQQLGIDKNAVYRYLDEGVLPGLRLGRKWLISESGLIELLKREEREQTDARRTRWTNATTVSLEKFIGAITKLRPTPRAKQVMARTREEALTAGRGQIGCEDILLAMSKQPDCMAAKLLTNLGVSPSSLIETPTASEQEAFSNGNEIGLTSQAQKALRLAVREARRMSHRYLGTEHLLLGVLEAGEGSGYKSLTAQGASAARVRTEVSRLLERLHPAR